MSTTQSEDPNERVAHPRHYNQHPSNIECIELIEHLPANLALATKYIWRHGLKQTETPLRDLQSARWYTERESQRVDLYELDDEPRRTTYIIWRALARKVIMADRDSTLADYLEELLNGSFTEMLAAIDHAISELDERKAAP